LGGVRAYDNLGCWLLGRAWDGVTAYDDIDRFNGRAWGGAIAFNLIGWLIVRAIKYGMGYGMRCVTADAKEGYVIRCSCWTAA